MEPMERYTKRRFAVPQAIAPTSSSPDTSRAKSRVVRYALPPGRLAPQARSAVSRASQRPPTSTATNSPTPTSSARRRTTGFTRPGSARRSEEHTSELQSPDHLVCRLLLEKKKKEKIMGVNLTADS